MKHFHCLTMFSLHNMLHVKFRSLDVSKNLTIRNKRHYVKIKEATMFILWLASQCYVIFCVVLLLSYFKVKLSTTLFVLSDLGSNAPSKQYI